MIKYGFLLLLSAIFAPLILLLPLANSGVVLAEDSPGVSDQRMVVILVDGTSIRAHESGIDLMTSFVSLLSSLDADQDIMLFSVEEPYSSVAQFKGRDANVKQILNKINNKFVNVPDNRVGGIAEALTATLSTLSKGFAASGSDVYLLLGKQSDKELDRLSRQLIPLAARYGKNGWAINGVSLSGSQEHVVNFLRSMADYSNGQLFDISTIVGLTQVADSVFRSDNKELFTKTLTRKLLRSEVFNTEIKIVPGTANSSLVMFKESSDGSVWLSDPSGFEVLFGDSDSSYVLETPHVIIWKLIDPQPGVWKLNSRGVVGEISIFEHSKSNYNLIFDPPDLISVTEPPIFSAHLEYGNKPVPVESVRLVVGIKTPNGESSSYRMSDNGVGNDAVSGDGIYTVTVPPQTLAGEYRALLELTWLDLGHTITTVGGFESIAFPSIEVNPIRIDNLIVGMPTNVATILVHVDGQPHPVDIGELLVSMASNPGREGVVELKPKRLSDKQTTAWEYDVIFTPKNVGRFTQVFRLTTEYKGKAFVYSSAPVILSSVLPPVSVSAGETADSVPVPNSEINNVNPKIRNIVETNQSIVSQPISKSILEQEPFETESSQLEWYVFVLVAIILLISIGAITFLLFGQVSPYGYLYSDQGEPIISFASVKRNPLVAFVMKSQIRGDDLHVPGLEGVVFLFSRGRIRLKSLQNKPSVRVNNQPLVDQTVIQDKTWIGARGRLYSFVLSSPITVNTADVD